MGTLLFLSPAILVIIIAIIITTIIILANIPYKKNSSSSLSEISQIQNGNPVIIVQEKGGNGVGTAGFVLALIGLIFCWVPVVNWILWILGAILSIVGCFREPRGLAIAGVVISFIGLILIIAIIGAFAALLS